MWWSGRASGGEGLGLGEGRKRPREREFVLAKWGFWNYSIEQRGKGTLMPNTFLCVGYWTVVHRKELHAPRQKNFPPGFWRRESGISAETQRDIKRKVKLGERDPDQTTRPPSQYSVHSLPPPSSTPLPPLQYCWAVGKDLILGWLWTLYLFTRRTAFAAWLLLRCCSPIRID